MFDWAGVKLQERKHMHIHSFSTTKNTFDIVNFLKLFIQGSAWQKKAKLCRTNSRTNCQQNKITVCRCIFDCVSKLIFIWIFFHPRSCVEVNIRLENKWTTIDENATFTVVANSFIAGGKGGYTTFGTTSDKKKTDLGIIDDISFFDYCEQVGTLKAPPLKEWSTVKYTKAGNSDFGTCATSRMPTSKPSSKKLKGRSPTKEPKTRKEVFKRS